MAAASNSHHLAIGRGGLHQLHASLVQRAGDQAIAILQESGYAAGAGLFETYRQWLKDRHGLDKPEELDAGLLASELTAFFEAQGWGSLSVAPLAGAIAVDSGDWAEAEPGSAQTPMCFFSAGMLADFMGRLSGEPVAVMEVECRSRNDGRCRFLAASAETLQRVYELMTQGKSYQDALQG